jgi:hypothetical protein
VLQDIFPFIIGFGLIVVLPVVSMLLNHQRRMAELIRREPQIPLPNPEVERRLAGLESQMSSLHDKLNTLILNQESSQQDLAKRLENRS